MITFDTYDEFIAFYCDVFYNNNTPIKILGCSPTHLTISVISLN